MLVVAAGLLGLLCGVWTPDADQARFRLAGEAMLGAQFFDAFADSWIQIGPVFLVPLGLLSSLLALIGLPDRAAAGVIAGLEAAFLTWLLLLVVRQAAGNRPSLAARWVVGTTFVAGGFLADLMLSDHPEELAVGLLLAAAGLTATRGRPVVAALLVVLATGVKQWGPIGGGVLLRSRPWPRVVLAVGAFVVGVALVYGPFRLWGEMNTFDLQWPFPEDSLLARVADGTGLSHWTLRVVQGGLAGVVGVLVACRRHGSVLTVVICALSVRLFLDPLRLTYYWAPLVALLLVWVWTSEARGIRRWRWAVTAPMPIAPLVPYLVPVSVWSTLGDVVTIAIPLACLLVEARHARVPAPVVAAAPTGAADR